MSKGTFGGEPMIDPLMGRSPGGHLHFEYPNEEYKVLSLKQSELLETLDQHYGIGEEVFDNKFHSDYTGVIALRTELLRVTDILDSYLPEPCKIEFDISLLDFNTGFPIGY